MKSYQNYHEVPMVEACGPVQTAEGWEYCVGVIRAASNKAEMQALIEALCRAQGPSTFQQSDENSGFVKSQGVHR